MKSILAVLLLVLVGLLSSCAPAGVSAQTEQLPELPPYAGPKAKLVLGEFECNANNCELGVGRGISDAMVTTMVLSDRFSVVEAAANLGVLTAELNVTDEADAFQGADLAIIGNIIQFEPNASGSGGGGGIGSIFGSVLGGFAGQKSASATIDIRVVDIKTRTIVTATRVTGEATSTALGGGGRLGSIFRGAVGGSFSQYENTPMETALQKMVINAVIDLGDKIPQEYYKY
jgi:curli biogenesis system outer membrane secretion channel CsgG